MIACSSSLYNLCIFLKIYNLIIWFLIRFGLNSMIDLFRYYNNSTSNNYKLC